MGIDKVLKQMVLASMAFMSAGGASVLAAEVHVDQVGYLTDHTKQAMVSEADSDSFRLLDAKTGTVVYEGKLSAAKYDPMSEENISVADFTDFKKPGLYRLAAGDRESYDFAIGDNVYAVPMVQTWRSYTLSRSGTPMQDSLTGLAIREGHAQDKQAEVYFTDQLNNKGDKVDVSGGWYDAGDYGKYTTTAALASAELMMAYEANPDHFTSGQLFFPQGVRGEKNLPDALSEVKFELDWLRKMQRKDGSTFHKVAGAWWPGFDVTPDTDTQPRYLYSTATSSTAMYGASLAVGARVLSSFDRVYAQNLQKDALRVWQYLEKTAEPVYRVDEGQESGSGPYNKNTDREERLWLAAELFKTTGDKKYEAALKKDEALFTTKPGFFTWDNTLALAQYAYATSPQADPALQARVRAAFLSYADEICRQIAGDGYRCSLKQEEYTWASTKNALTKGDILLMANELQPKREYVEGALDQVHYLFGRNALDRSFMTGVGDNPPEHPHNRIHESTGAYVPGLVVGGPNAVSGGDPDQTAYLASKHVPISKSYLDVLTSWSTNEYAIDYTATAAYALAYFAKVESAMQARDLKLQREFPSITR